MEREVDLTPAHLMAWLRADLADGSQRLKVRASREFVCEEAPASAPDLDAEDGMEVLLTVGHLEVEPANGKARWLLRMRIEDPFGSHLPEDGSVPDEPEQIGLDEFEACFLAAGDPASTCTLEAGCAADARGFDRVLARILSDRHRFR